MQTFLPVDSFEQSAKILDNKRLGKQRIEAYQILQTLFGLSGGWKNHPAIKMWRGYEDALIWYYSEICREWIRRGYKHTLPILIPLPQDKIKLPLWFGRDNFHAAHRSNLLRKDFAYYSQYGWSEPADLPYVWGML